LYSLYQDQRRFTKAHRALDRAKGIYLQLEARRLAGRVLVQKSHLYCMTGEPLAAASAAEEALSLLDEKADLDLYVAAVHNQISALTHAERYVEARRRMDAARSLYEEQPSPLIALRARWVDARIRRGLGELHQAARQLEEVRQGFINRALGFDAALAGLDLALVYVELGESERVRQLAREMVPIFQAQDITRDTLAALLLFEEASRREAVTASMLEELIRYMQTARHHRDRV
jgi:hypothetical protein